MTIKKEFYQLLSYTDDVDLNQKLEDCRNFYNSNRSHGSFKGKTLYENLKLFCQKQAIELYYIQPGKPTQNSLIERFNRTFRTDFLNAYLFENIKEMKNYTEIWMWMYNNERPHSS
ncbi:integrase core domain-containing protein [Empedobacter falsenii]|uniref:integrase core domain-containing protein n=1 Tax=Empedobacter falsenii TaxID=343874 RepID=UPI001C8EE503|nr:integrase core domain-containing protein [Empedobacter falsenii]MBY0068257.1 integrase core domain-containing protein [Empedobacter falsenii]